MLRIAVCLALAGCFLSVQGTQVKALDDQDPIGAFGPDHYGSDYRERMRRGWRRGRHWRRMFHLSRADLDQDGTIAWEEVEKLRGRYFGKFDLNNDGVVSKDEIEALVRKRVEKRVKRLTRWFDRNHDGKISKKEFDWRAKERFNWRDINEDNKLSGDELPPRFHSMQAYRKSMKGDMGKEEFEENKAGKDDIDSPKKKK